MQATTNAFDTLVRTIGQDLESDGMAIEQKPQGQAGQRCWAFSLNWVESTVYADVAQFMDYITNTTGMDAQELYSFVDGQSNHEGSNHSYLVGEVSDDPERCWALLVHAHIPYDSNLNPSARFSALEDRQAIQDALGKLTNDELTRATRDINSVVNSFAGGDNGKLMQLLDALGGAPGGQWVDGLAAYLSRRGMEMGTPDSGKAAAAPRM